jgi:erythromycin esterase
VIVELVSPKGVVFDAIDGPTGRQGDEGAEILAAESGRYQVRVRPFDASEPVAAYRIALRARRNVAETRRLLATRRAVRDEATSWLRSRTTPDLSAVSAIAGRARVVGLGEATHGSRELGDLRLALTRRLIENDGYRVVAIEASADYLAALAPYVAGETAVPGVRESGWIGRRAVRELAAWLHDWNAKHPTDRVRLAGVDAQENAASRQAVDVLLEQAYDEKLIDRWNVARKEIAAADEQTPVFGDSSISAETRQFLFDLVSRLALDAPVLRARFGASSDRALEGAQNLAAFADFNSGAGQSRDWYMAAGVLRALEESGPSAKAVFWAHNAHIAARTRTSGAVLRTALGCAYAPIALTFGEGAFVAQIPNDPEARLKISSLPAATDDSIEGAIAPLSAGKTVIASWPCGVDPATAPAWLRVPRAMHWVGGLWAPDSVVRAGYRAFDVLHDFDALVYVPRVSAEEITGDRSSGDTRAHEMAATGMRPVKICMRPVKICTRS